MNSKDQGPKDGAAANRAAVAKTRQGHRDRGEVPKERWAHPDDWPDIDAYIRAKAEARTRPLFPPFSPQARRRDGEQT